MNSLSWYLAKRYMPFRQGAYAIRAMGWIAFFSIAIGAFSLTLVTSIMNGLHYAIVDKMQHINPAATIYADDPIQFQALAHALKEKVSAVQALSPYAVAHGMIHSDYIDAQDQPRVVVIKAIDPERELSTTSLQSKMKHTIPISTIKDNVIVIGNAMALALGLTEKDSATLLYLERPDGKSKKVTAHEKLVTIGGIFETGIEEIDNGVVYVSHELFNALFPDQGITQVGISFNPEHSIDQAIEHIHQITGLTVMKWQELYAPLMSALILEKYAMFLILFLITVVASMNIIALLFMIITHKRADIAMLRALGVSHSTITLTFVYVGIIISCCASLCGILAAAVASLILETYPFITLPDVYYVSHLPARMNVGIGIIVFIAITIITSVASWFSAQKIRSVSVAHILRFEG